MIACRTAELSGTPKGLAPAAVAPDPAARSLAPLASLPSGSRTGWLHIHSRGPDIPASGPAIVAAPPGPVGMGTRWRRYEFATHGRWWTQGSIPVRLGLSRGDGQNQSARGDEELFLHPISLLKADHLNVRYGWRVVVKLQRICTSSEADPWEEPGVTEVCCGARQ
jgi:hypothetical protein